MANQLHKMGETLSQAFRKAWQLIKSGTLTTKVKGVTFGNAQRAIERLTHYQTSDIIIELEREKANLFDSNAVAVRAGIMNKGTVKIGYLPAPLAKLISTLIDTGIAVKALYKEIRGKYESYMNYGIEICLSL